MFLALDNDLEIIPVLNKIDLPSADPEGVKAEIEEAIGLSCTDAVSVSAKTGANVDKVLDQIIAKIPPPRGEATAPLRALIVDSWYDSYQGVVVLFRVMDGTISLGDRIRMMSTGAEFEVTRLGAFSPGPIDFRTFGPGEAGFLCASIKILTAAKVGDPVTQAATPAASPLPGFKEVKPMVFCGLYPVDAAEYEVLKTALEKLRLNDVAFTYEPETSQALGFGFRCGFLGLLHMEIIQERLEREFGANLIATAPSVIYKVETTSGETISIDNPSKLPKAQEIAALYEPYARLEIHTPNEYVGGVFKLCEEKRGIQKDVRYLTATRVIITYELPFAEIVYDFFDRLKSATRGYASLDYEITDYRASDLVKLDIMINGDPVDALAVIVHRENAYPYGRGLALKLKRTIPASSSRSSSRPPSGTKIIARNATRPWGKNVTAQSYGGDITRKRKLLEKQRGRQKADETQWSM